MKKALSFLLFSIFLVGCTPKIIYKNKLICTHQESAERIEVNLRIHKDDLELANIYKSWLDMSFDLYENQVLKNNELCEGIK